LKQRATIGFDVDMAKGIAKAMGVKLELVSTAWDGIIPALLTKKYERPFLPPKVLTLPVFCLFFCFKNTLFLGKRPRMKNSAHCSTSVFMLEF
jgi:hypothetical protein